MTSEVTQTDALKTWWDTAEFDGKAFCTLKDNGDLVLLKTDAQAERVIATLTKDNATTLTKALVEKFTELQGRVTELQQEWESSDDKMKLMGKVARVKDYLLHANAIGNFQSLLSPLLEWERVLAKQAEENYNAKLAIVTQAEALGSDSDNWKEATQTFKDLADAWRNLGYVEKQRSDELWERFEAAKNKFYDRKRQHHEDNEKEMLQNLDLKLEVVERAEGMAESDDWKQTTEAFRQLMDQWRAIGHTWNDKNEELWSRFILAKNMFFERKNAHFEAIRTEQEANYLLKLALVERAETLKESKEWSKTTTAYAALMEEWKVVGRVPAEKADELWNRLHAAKDHFFSNKRQHTETLRVTLEDNYAQKQSLAKRAEELKNSTLWRETTEELNELLTEWKKIGPIPREHGDSLWEQFIAARKHFFNRKDADRERRKQLFEKKSKEKEERAKNFLHELKAELKEEQEKLVDFREALNNVTPGNKEKELRAHLEKLIKGCEQKIKHKEELIAELTQQGEAPPPEPQPDETADTEQ